MRLDPRSLAAAIAAAANPPIPGDVLDQLALALSRGEGVARAGNTVYLVLRSPWEADNPANPTFRPTLLRGTLPVSANARRFRTTRQVVSMLTTLGNTGPRPANKPTFAPAIAIGARVPLSGAGLAGAPTVTTTFRGHKITWFDVNTIPVGGFLYRVRTDCLVTLYQRVGANQWFLMRLQDGTHDIVDLPQVLHELCAATADESLEGLEVMEGGPVLLRTP